MRPGPPRGEQADLQVVVTEEMLEPSHGDLPGIYGLPAMVGHMGRVARMILEPHLEAGEIGVDDQADIDRRLPVTVGTTVTLLATVAKVAPQQLVCEVLLRANGLLVARGSHTLRVVDADTHGRDIAAQG